MPGIYDLSRGWFTHVNPAGVQLLDYPSKEAFLTDPQHPLRVPPWTPAQWQHLCEFSRSKDHHELETDIRRHVGKPFRAHVKLTYGEVAGRPLLLVNLTEHNRLQQAERTLAHSVRRFEAVLTNATLGRHRLRPAWPHGVRECAGGAAVWLRPGRVAGPAD